MIGRILECRWELPKRGGHVLRGRGRDHLPTHQHRRRAGQHHGSNAGGVPEGCFVRVLLQTCMGEQVLFEPVRQMRSTGKWSEDVDVIQEGKHVIPAWSSSCEDRRFRSRGTSAVCIAHCAAPFYAAIHDRAALLQGDVPQRLAVDSLRIAPA